MGTLASTSWLAADAGVEGAAGERRRVAVAAVADANTSPRRASTTARRGKPVLRIP
jgi:hypothetical protein